MRTIGGRYELRGELASGGMATVHLARQLGAAGFARIVAVKRLHERYARDPEFVAMFLDEARIVGRIRHPNVVQTLDVVQEKSEDTSASELFIVMEYIHGDSLARLLNRARKEMQSVPLRIASAIMNGVLLGLHEAHEARSETGEPLDIVHRDVSPHNVLVGIDGVARVLDFGVAKAEERMASSTSDGKVKGKLAYMAPEQLSGDADIDIDRRTDIYAAAIVLWEVLTGQKLFQGTNDAATIKLVMDANISAPSLLNSQVSPALDAVVFKGLAQDRERRFGTAAELAHALAEAVPPATASELGAWVRKTAQEDLDLKTKLIASIEARGIAKSKSEAAKSLNEAVGRPPPPDETQLTAGGSPKAPTTAPMEKPLPAPVKQTVRMPTSPSSPPPNAAAPFPALKATQLMPDPQTGTRSAVMVSQPPALAPRKPLSPLIIVAATAVGVFVAGGAILGGVLLLRPRAQTVPPPASIQPSPPTLAAPIACPDGMVLAPSGQFFMGSDEHASAEKPAHKVTLHAFCIDRNEVTVAAYKECSDRGNCRRLGMETAIDDLTPKRKRLFDSLCNVNDDTRLKHPANCVDWERAKAFCESRGARLPTEAEWEYAARGPEQRMYAWGEPPPDAKLMNGCGLECTKWFKSKGESPLAGGAGGAPLYNADDGWPTTAPVGSFPAGASRIGAQDMQGNVWEWVADYYALYDKDGSDNPTGPESGRDRIIRGGAWDSTSPEWLRATYRFPALPSVRSHLIGFRCAKTL